MTALPRGTADLHVGYLVQQFPPEVGAGPARVIEMSRHWIAAGARVTVLTGMPNRPEGRIHAGYRGRLFIEEEWEGIRVLRSWLFASPRHGVARTIANNVSFMLTSALHGLLRARDIDILIASSPPLFPHVAGRAIQVARGIPLVLEVRDLWPDYLVDMGVIRRGSALAGRLFALERRLLRAADAVTVVTRSFARRAVDKGVAADRIHLMPPGVDPDFYFLSAEPPPLPALARSTPDEFLVGYLGNFGAGQGLATIVDAAAALQRTRPAIRFVLVGDGTEGEKLRLYAAERGVSNLQIHAPLPKEQTRAFYASCDICLVPLAPVPVFQETIPSKLFEILACERPLIASLAGEAQHIVEASAGGWVSPPGDAERLGAAVLRAADTDRAELKQMGQRGRDYVIRNFSRRTIAERYLELLESLSVQRP